GRGSRSAAPRRSARLRATRPRAPGPAAGTPHHDLTASERIENAFGRAAASGPERSAGREPAASRDVRQPAPQPLRLAPDDAAVFPRLQVPDVAPPLAGAGRGAARAGAGHPGRGDRAAPRAA